MVSHGPARADVVDDLLARRPREHGLGEKRSGEVTRDELARVVDEEAAVGVAVVCDSEVGVLLHDLRHDELAILREERVRLVVREGSVGFEVAAHDVELRQAFENAGSMAPAMPFAASTTTRSGRMASTSTNDSTFETKVGQTSSLRTAPRRSTSPKPASARALISTSPESPPTGARAAAHDLHPGVLLRVMRRGDADSTVEAELRDRVVEHLRPDEPELDDIGSAVGDSR